MNDFENKVAVITGGTGGIGLALAEALAEDKCHVVLADLDGALAQEKAEALKAHGVDALGLACDVTDTASVEAMADAAWAHFGHVDLLFNNAGVGGGSTPLSEISENDLRWIFEVNFFGNFLTCQHFVKRFLEQGTPAHVCNTGSENSLAWVLPNMAAYNASKAALLGYTGVLRMELPEFISVSLLCPGLTKTGIMQSGKLKQDRFGGPDAQVMPQEIIDAIGGYPADSVGRHTLEEIKKGSFFIVPHFAARHIAEERMTEITAAFDAQTQETEDWLNFDTRAVIRKMTGG